ncbi:diguanylate cyclase domain-containing protein [Nocardioides pelophilus]|uniref:diguanylate cyclase domain-containing protein n=1 Tax=Nocardioides pelophilus TaxID=2172019 RepID=UPI0016001FEE|nr:diguanylate cyclase [Nocardioides pelophilus]
MSRSSRVRDVALMGLAYGTLSFLVIQATTFGYPTGAVFWPGAGLTLGVLVRLPRERWPALLTGVFVAEIVVDLSIPVSFGVALIWAVANTVEPLVGASLLMRSRRPEGLTSVSLVLRFVLWAVVVGPLVGATVGAAAATAAGVETFWPTWPRWWMGDAIGVLVVAPAVFTLRRADLAKAGRSERWVLLAALAAVTLVAVFPWQVDAWVQGLPFLLTPALVLVAMRLGAQTAAISLAVSATTVNTVTAMGVGPFSVTGTYSGLVVAQVCLAGGAFALLTVSALNHDLVSVQRVEEILREQALHDGLTGLANRRLLEDRLESSLAGLRRSRAHLAVLLVDLDGFKRLNDEHGHLAGDAALVEVADRLRAAVRPSDTVARVGGDEFVVVLPDLSDLTVAEVFRDRVSVALNQPMRWEDTELPLAASVGVSSTDDPEASVDSVLAAADRAMYAVKVAARSRSADGQ